MGRARNVLMVGRRHAHDLTSEPFGARLDSRATIGEGVQNMLCAYLAAAVLAGLLANTWFGLWWADPIIALGIAALAVQGSS